MVYDTSLSFGKMTALTTALVEFPNQFNEVFPAVNPTQLKQPPDYEGIDPSYQTAYVEIDPTGATLTDTTTFTIQIKAAAVADATYAGGTEGALRCIAQRDFSWKEYKKLNHLEIPLAPGWYTSIHAYASASAAIGAIGRVEVILTTGKRGV